MIDTASRFIRRIVQTLRTSSTRLVESIRTSSPVLEVGAAIAVTAIIVASPLNPFLVAEMIDELLVQIGKSISDSTVGASILLLVPGTFADWIKRMFRSLSRMIKSSRVAYWARYESQSIWATQRFLESLRIRGRNAGHSDRIMRTVKRESRWGAVLVRTFHFFHVCKMAIWKMRFSYHYGRTSTKIRNVLYHVSWNAQPVWATLRFVKALRIRRDSTTFGDRVLRTVKRESRWGAVLVATFRFVLWTCKMIRNTLIVLAFIPSIVYEDVVKPIAVALFDWLILFPGYCFSTAWTWTEWKLNEWRSSREAKKVAIFMLVAVAVASILDGDSNALLAATFVPATTIRVSRSAFVEWIKKVSPRLRDPYYYMHVLANGHIASVLSGSELVGNAKKYSGYYYRVRQYVQEFADTILGVKATLVPIKAPSGSIRHCRVWTIGCSVEHEQAIGTLAYTGQYDDLGLTMHRVEYVVPVEIVIVDDDKILDLRQSAIVENPEDPTFPDEVNDHELGPVNDDDVDAPYPLASILDDLHPSS